MELRGLEPLTYALPARRSGQLSYSPVECEVVCKVNACPLAVARGRQPEVHDRPVGEEPDRQQEATIKISAGDPEQVHLVLGIRTEHVTPRRMRAGRNGRDCRRNARPAVSPAG